MDLSDWQRSLELHFASLSRDRSSLYGGRPIFALEHDLDANTIESLNSDIRSHIAFRAPSDVHPLPWIVYATEIGYQYAGNEYWTTFEEMTPGWERSGNRNWLRQTFFDFHRRYGGARPTGVWASHFSIISWPIVHAVLPLDLQIHLSRILFQLRYSFSSAILDSPEELGELIHRHSWKGNSRFAQFTQERSLVGQISSALLHHEDSGPQPMILASTLARIGKDLDRVQRNREWLVGAKEAARRVRTTGLTQHVNPTNDARRVSLEQMRNQVPKSSLEPRFALRPTAAGKWAVWLELPNFSEGLAAFPDLLEVVANSRAIVGSSKSKPLARGRLLYASQKLPLAEWPKENSQLIEFVEVESPQLDLLLKSECSISSGEPWLFRVQTDGWAYEQKSRIVRPGQDYIVLRTSKPFAERTNISTVSMDCLGIHAALIELPDSVPSDTATQLENEIGVQLARYISVKPVGMPAVSWDGEGHAEWLTTENPKIEIRASYPLDWISVDLDSDLDERMTIATMKPGEPVFVELPRLPVGSHNITVAAAVDDPQRKSELGSLQVLIRPPRTSGDTYNPQEAVQITMDPPAPTLQELWTGKASIQVDGPRHRTATGIVSLLGNQPAQPLFSVNLPKFELPVGPARWRKLFNESVVSLEDARNEFDDAEACVLNLEVDGFGEYRILFERSFTPLRWKLAESNGEVSLRLIDDGDQETPTRVHHYRFDAPEQPEELDYSKVVQSLTPDDGGLFLARSAVNDVGIIFSHISKRKLTLGDLPSIIGEPKLSKRAQTENDVADLIKILADWVRAEHRGDTQTTAKINAVIESLRRHLYEILCGNNWAQLESALSNDQAISRLMSREKAKDSIPRNLARELVAETDRLAAYKPRTRAARFASILVDHRVLARNSNPAAAYLPKLKRRSRITNRAVEVPWQMDVGPQDPVWLCEFVLRMASQPEALQSWANQDYLRGIDTIIKNPILIRSARMLVHSIDNYLVAQDTGVDLPYEGWDW